MFSIGAGLVRHWFDIDNTGHVIVYLGIARLVGCANFEHTHVNQQWREILRLPQIEEAEKINHLSKQLDQCSNNSGLSN